MTQFDIELIMVLIIMEQNSIKTLCLVPTSVSLKRYLNERVAKREISIEFV